MNNQKYSSGFNTELMSKNDNLGRTKIKIHMPNDEEY